MSEKTMWQWLCQKMRGTSWKGYRIEGCLTKGLPDTVQVAGKKKSQFVELKDWSKRRKHPLTVEQFNFLNDFGGWVMVKTDIHTIYMIHSWERDLSPLTWGDKKYVTDNGVKINMVNFSPKKFIEEIFQWENRAM